MIKKLICKSGTFFFCTIPLFILISCVSTRSIPPDQISKTPSWKNLYYFHAEDSTWIVKPVPAAGNKFAGIIFKPEIIKKNRQVHIYASPLSSVKIVNGQISVPMENIVKVENYKINVGTIIASVGAVALLFLIPVFL
jgi:hypothetical protein